MSCSMFQYITMYPVFLVKGVSSPITGVFVAVWWRVRPVALTPLCRCNVHGMVRISADSLQSNDPPRAGGTCRRPLACTRHVTCSVLLAAWAWAHPTSLGEVVLVICYAYTLFSLGLCIIEEPATAVVQLRPLMVLWTLNLNRPKWFGRVLQCTTPTLHKCSQTLKYRYLEQLR
jgi:hypothetical protein